MAGQDIGNCEYGRLLYGGCYIGEMEHGSIPAIGSSVAEKIRNLSVKVSGVWTKVSKAWVKVSASWVEGSVSAKISGVWTLIHEK